MAGPAYHGRTHMPGGTDPIPGLTTTTGPGLEDMLIARGAVGLWKLNETAGTTAADSSGNGNDMTVPGFGYLPPTWSQAAGPPGTVAAKFFDEPTLSDAGARVSVGLPSALTNNFSAGVWAKLPVGANSLEVMGQGLLGAANSWGIHYNSPTSKFIVRMGATDFADANNAFDDDVWYLIGFTRDTGTTTMYVEGLAQSTTTATSPGTSTAATWLGNCGAASSVAHGGGDVTLSWAFITDTPISGAEWMEIYTAGQTGGDLAAGLVWSSDGSGGADWAAPTIEVTY